VKLPVFLLCLVSQFLFFAFVRGEARRPEASVAQAALPEALADTARFVAPAAQAAPGEASTLAARVAIAQAVLDGDLDAWLPQLHALALAPGEAAPARLAGATRGARDRA
jgi:hypothetical protein